MKKMLSALMLLASFNVLAADPQIGKDFDKTLQVIPSDNPNKIEVTEVFWYGCIHCYHMDPLLNAWVKKLTADVVFKRIPGLPQPAWAPMAKAFYAMDDLKLSDKLHTALFDAINKEKVLDPTNEIAAIDWMAKKSGLDKSKVEASFIINGQFITSSTMAGGNEQALKTVDYIVGNIRADKTNAAKK